MGKDENSCGIQCLSTGHSERGDAWLLWNVFIFTIIVFLIVHYIQHSVNMSLISVTAFTRHNVDISFWPAALIQCWNHGKDNKHQPPLTSCQNKDKEQQLYHQHHHMRLTWLMRMRMMTRMVKIMMVIILIKIMIIIIMPIKIMMMMITGTRDWPSAVLRCGLTVRYITSLTICQRH